MPWANFGQVSLVHNDIFAVATLTGGHEKEANLLLTRYFFAQLWCEFTKEVLTEFFSEDLNNKAVLSALR